MLCRDTFSTYKAAQKHQQQNPGHVCLSKTSTEHRALKRSRISIPLISEPQIQMVRVSTTSTITLPTTSSQQSKLQAPLFQPEPQQPGTSTNTPSTVPQQCKLQSPLFQSEPQQPGSSTVTLPLSEPQSQLTQPQQQQQAR